VRDDRVSHASEQASHMSRVERGGAGLSRTRDFEASDATWELKADRRQCRHRRSAWSICFRGRIPRGPIGVFVDGTLAYSCVDTSGATYGTGVGLNEHESTAPFGIQSFQIGVANISPDLPLDFFLGIGAMENNYMNVKGDLRSSPCTLRITAPRASIPSSTRNCWARHSIRIRRCGSCWVFLSRLR
jgi:hypothetical protein